jgi:tricorn protease interacting factor F2/3
VDLKSLKFDGKVQIKLESENDVKLNSQDLKILEAKANGKPVKYDLKNEDLTLNTGKFSGLLELGFQGTIFSDKMMGFYKASYDNGYVASTQFEPASARRMFPCVDHPLYKAEFKLAVRTDKENTVLSNMPVTNEKTEGSKKIVEFQKTPRMSTYLLYVGVGQFEQNREKQGRVEYAVATVKGKLDTAKFALSLGPKVIDYFQSYFDLPYELPKLHLIAVPEFAVGAMENWGAITFREVALLADKTASVRQRKRIAEVVSHEIAHMWFGDLVTMKWWDDLWLNESFATFMAYKAVDHINPEWDCWEDFIRTSTGAAENRDSLMSTHPIQVRVNTPGEIEELFDDISYGKGASIIRMIEAYAGENNFMNGVRSYLQKHKYGNAEGSELWTSIGEAARTNVNHVMGEWIRKAGFPVLHLKLENNQLKIRQERFLLSANPDPTIWPVPITLKINGETKRLLLEKKEDTIDLPNRVQSLLLNIDQTGFYIVNYDQLYSYVWKAKLSGFEKYGIISDAFFLTLQGSMKLQDYTQLVERYIHEQEKLPVHEVSDELSFLYSIAPGNIRDISRRFHRAQLERLQNQNDENSLELKGDIAVRLAMVDPDYARQLAGQFNTYDQADPNMKQAIATAYARSTGDFDTIYNKYKTTLSEEDKVRFIAALASFTQPAMVTRALNLCQIGEIKKQDVRTILAATRANPEARQATWTWMTSNFDWLHKIHEGSGSLGRVLQLTIPYVGIGRVGEVERFFGQHKPDDVKNSIETGIERLHVYDKLTRRIEQVTEKILETPAR